MTRTSKLRRYQLAACWMCAAGICLFSATGCQVSENGQVLPSPNYLVDDVGYAPAGPEFKLSREAAALQAARAEEQRNQQ